jgi:hypothetical protein
MEKEQFDRAEKLLKLINNHKGLIKVLEAPLLNALIRVSISNNTPGSYNVDTNLLCEIIATVKNSLHRLEEEFNQI